jgi:glycosyltransferase involved in cell wall biosynthesis
MRVLHVIPDLHAGGAERMLTNLLTRFPGLGIDSAVTVLRTGGPLTENVTAAGVPLFSWEVPFGIVSRARYRAWHEFLDEHPCDLVQGWMVHGNTAAFILGRLHGLPVVWNVRQSYVYSRHDSWSANVLSFLSRFMSPAVNRIIFNSDAGRQVFSHHGYPRVRSLVIPNGVDTGVFTPGPRNVEVRRKLGIPEHAPVVGMVARYHPIKGFDVFCAAAVKIRAVFPGAVFLLCGQGVDPSNRELMRLLRDSGVRDRVILTGYRGDIPQVLSAMDVLVSSSYSEALSNAIGEAMSCGVPCVSTDTGDSAALIGDTGEVVPVGSAASLADAVARLLSLTTSDRQHRGMRARQRILKNFSLEVAAESFANVYRSLAATASEQESVPCAASPDF